MKQIVKIITLFIFCSEIASVCPAQYQWELRKDEDGIKVYRGTAPGSAFKAIKVECTLDGSLSNLANILSQVDLQKEWVFHSKTAYLLKRVTPYDLYYYAETAMPWPLVNRDAAVHLVLTKDSVQHTLIATGTSVPKYVPEEKDKVRIPHSLVKWNVTEAAQGKVHIIYTIEVDPGGSLPAWLVNMFADKGPYESFKKLAELLKK